VRENEDWTLRVDTGVYDPVLGESYQTFSRLGLSFQRSQNGGLFSAQPGPSVSYYKRLQSIVDAPAKESSFFDGIDTTIPGIYKALRKTAPAGAEAALQAIGPGDQVSDPELQDGRAIRVDTRAGESSRGDVRRAATARRRS
jgi:hypothetical protein